MSLIRLVEFKSIGDGRGNLVAIEGGSTVPFEIKRLYYMTGMKPGVPRGFHAHKQLQQMAICVAGKCRMVLDDGARREETWLDAPDKGLLIGNMIWREMHDFSEGCVLVVLASEHYSEADYIRDYDEFLALAKHAQDS